MHVKRLIVGLSMFGAILFAGALAHAAPPPNISYTVGVCDPSFPQRCVKPNADGSIVVNSTGGGAVTIADGADVTQGAVADLTASSDVGNFSSISLLKGILHAAQDNTAVPVSQSGAWSVTALGAGTAGAAVTGNPVRYGCRAATADPTAVTDGQLVDEMCGTSGKRVVLPYSIKELAVRGSTGAVTGTTQTSIIAPASGSLKNYITAIQCANSGASTSILTFTDAAATVLINPAGGGVALAFPIPLVTAAATAFQVTPGTASTSQYCSAQGYTGL